LTETRTIHVDDLIDKQSLTGRNYFLLALLMIALLCDGFDLQLLAFAAPRLAKAWGLAPEALQYVIVANLAGMMCGAMFLGNLGDRFGRKRIIVLGTLLYALMSLCCLLAENRLQLGILRFVTGLGLGGVLPNVVALTAEISPAKNRARLTAIPMIGMSLGSGLPSVVAAWLVPIYGWQALFVAGGIIPVVVAIVIAIALPESLLFLAARGREVAQLRQRVQALDPGLALASDTKFALRNQKQVGQQRATLGDLFKGDLGIVTPLLWLMFACTLLSMHFINSWMSVVLNQAGLSEVQTAFTNGVLHWGGTAASIATVFVLGRFGLHWALTLLMAGLVGVFTIATTGFASPLLLTGAVTLAGFGIIGCQGVLNVSAGLIYPVSCRSTGAGAALGVGRIGSLLGPVVGATILSQHWAPHRLFFVPLLPLSIAAVATFILITRGVNIRNRQGVAAH
jgi:MFS transporter, AAHS family, 4-hydroxybenzoate transporter